jgi:hypothetical protein
MPEFSRRRFFGLLAAPAIVRAASLMPISATEIITFSRQPKVLLLGASAYWHFANEIRPLFTKSVAEPPLESFLHKLNGFEIYQDNKLSTRRDALIAQGLLSQLQGAMNVG